MCEATSVIIPVYFVCVYVCACAHVYMQRCTYVHLSVGFCLFIVWSMQQRWISLTDTAILTAWSQYLKVVDGVTEKWLSSSKHLVLLQRTWDQILRTHIPPDVVAHVYNPSTPRGRQTGEPPESQGPASPVYCSQLQGGSWGQTCLTCTICSIAHMCLELTHTWTPTQRLKEKEWLLQSYFDH